MVGKERSGNGSSNSNRRAISRSPVTSISSGSRQAAAAASSFLPSSPSTTAGAAVYAAAVGGREAGSFESAAFFGAPAAAAAGRAVGVRPQPPAATAAALAAGTTEDTADNRAAVTRAGRGNTPAATPARTTAKERGERARRSEMRGLLSRSAPRLEQQQQQQESGREEAAALEYCTDKPAVLPTGDNVVAAGGSAVAAGDAAASASPAAAFPSGALSLRGAEANTSSLTTAGAGAATKAPGATDAGEARRSPFSSPLHPAVAGAMPSRSIRSSSPHLPGAAASSPSAASTTPATPTLFSTASSAAASAAAAAAAASPRHLSSKSAPSSASSTSPPADAAAAGASAAAGPSGPASAALAGTAADAAVASREPTAAAAAGREACNSACSGTGGTDKEKLRNSRTIQFREVFIAPNDIASASSSSEVGEQQPPGFVPCRSRCRGRGGGRGRGGRGGGETSFFTLRRSLPSRGAQDFWSLMHGFTCCCDAFPGAASPSAAAGGARGEGEGGGRRSGSSSAESLVWGAVAESGAGLPHSCGAWRELCCRRFPLFFSEPPVEQHFARVQLQHISVRALLVTPLLMLACGCCYYAAAQNCVGAMCAAYAVELGVAEILFAALLIAMKAAADPLQKELFAVAFIAVLGVYRSVMCYLAFAVPAAYPTFFPLYATASILLNFLFLLLGIICLLIRVGYAAWLVVLFLLLTVPLGLLSLVRAAAAAEYSVRLWFTWLSVFIFLFPLLTVVLLVEATMREQQRRCFFLHLRTLLAEKQQVDAEAGAVLRSRSVRSSLAESVLASAARQLLEAHRRLRKNEPFDREFLAGLLEGTARFITSTDASSPPEYLKNEFTRSFVRDLLMGRSDCAPLSNPPTASMRRRSAFCIVPESNTLAALSGVGKDWNWSVLQLAATSVEPLVQVGMVLLSPFEFSAEVMLRPDVLRAFLHEVEKACKPNPYHNALHNAAVAHQALSLLRMIGLRDFVGDIEEMGFIVAALCHDIAHPGRNNNFMVNAGTALALTYNDISVLENMHASLTFSLLKNPLLNVLSHLDIDTFRALRKNMIEIILSTDMKVHFDSLSRFRLRRDTGCFDPQGDCEDRQQTLCMVVKAADVGHGALQWAAHEQWCKRVVTEFYDQGDEEKRRGLPVSFLCDRTQHETEFLKSQVAFLEFVVKPLFVEMEGVENMQLQSETSETGEVAKTCLANLNNNTEEWRSRERQRVENLGLAN